MKINVQTTYSACISTLVELPGGKTEKDISDVWVKWGEITLQFKDGTELKRQEQDLSMDDIDWKRPSNTQLCDEEFNEFEPSAVC